MRFDVDIETWPLARPFRTASHMIESLELIVVHVERDGVVGRGEAVGVHYRGETLQSMVEQIESSRRGFGKGVDRAALQSAMPPGGARNAVDCALWDLACKRESRTVWELTGIEPKPVTTCYTISLASADAMAAHAAEVTHPLLKLKLDGDDPVGKVRAVRAARADARLVVDANQGWTKDLLETAAPALAELGVEMIEQPLPAGQDDALEGLVSPVLLCGDESCQTSRDLPTAVRRYRMVNIKLDKTGGLTEALHLARASKAIGLDLMVGCMVGTSLGMAPSFVIAQFCRYVDLDGPLLLARDRENPMAYREGMAHPPSPSLWG